jgi:transposase
MSIDPSVKDHFIQLRAQGLSYAKIADKLQVSKNTLIALSKEFQTEIQNLQAIYAEALREKYFVHRDRRIELFGRRIETLLAELEKRKLEDLPTEKIMLLLLKFTLALKPEEKEVIFSQPVNIHDLLKRGETMTSGWHA